VTIDLDLTVGWTDFKILDHRINQTAGTLRPGKYIDEMTPEEISAKKRIINDPNILSLIWRPNIFIGKNLNL
jgi:hypothetical protein